MEKLIVEKSFNKSSIDKLANLGHDIQIVEDAIGGDQENNNKQIRRSINRWFRFKKRWFS